MSIPVKLATEDELSEAVMRKLLSHVDRGYSLGSAHGRTGFGYLRKSVPAWNRAAKRVPFIVLTDLDNHSCPSGLIQNWLSESKHPNMLLRVAVREVEAWLLADRANLAKFLRIAEKWIRPSPEVLSDPKAALVDAARKSRLEEIRQRIVPRTGSTATQGREYNACLCEFVFGCWDVEEAAKHSRSLARTLSRLRSFTPTW